jgi:hypothetical protein
MHFIPALILTLYYFEANYSTLILSKSIRRHLDYTSARLRRAVKVSSLLLTEFTDLKTEKMAAFALIRLRNAAIILFSAFSLSIFGHFCTLKCASYTRTGAFPSSLPSLL